MAVIDQKVSELGVKFEYLEKKVNEGNGWVEYKKLVLANQDESKILMQSLVKKVIELEKRNETIDQKQDQIQEDIKKIAAHDAGQVDKSDFAEVKKLVEGTDEKPGVRDMLKLYRRLHKLFWALLGGLLLVLAKTWIVEFFTSAP
jgi:hypothetical protein